MRLKKPTLLGFTRLDERINPADYYWTGTQSQDMTDARNWTMSHLPNQLGDVAHIDTTVQAVTSAPVLPANDNLTLTDFRIDHYNGTVTITGSLTVKASTFTDSAATVTGTGILHMDSGALSMPGSANHHWAGTAVKVQLPTVEANNYLEINGTGQIGPDAGATGSLSDHGLVTINNPGASQIGVGYANITVQSDGELDAIGNTNLVNVQAANASTHNLFQVSNAHTVVVSGARTLDLSGGYYTQSAGLTQLNQAAALTVEDTTGYADGSTSYAKNISFTGGEEDMYSFSGMTAANGDIRFSAANLAVKSCSDYSHQVGRLIVAEHGVGVSVSANTLIFAGNSILAFQDYTPSDAIAGSVTQSGAALNLTGDLTVGDTSTISLRADIGKGVYDFVTAAPGADGNWTLSGTSLTLKVDVRNAASNASLALNGFLYAGIFGTITSSSPPFGTLTLTGASGYSWNAGDPTNAGNELDGTIHH